MKRIVAIAAASGVALAFASLAAATTPSVNGAVVNTRIWNDCPSSTVTVSNTFPADVTISDADVNCFGYANLHNWHFSSDGGVTETQFNNADIFHFCADLRETGGGNGEAGLQISPWWAHNSDGLFNVRSTDGEIACFGGRLPFYSFSAPENGGVRYTKGNLIHLDVTYLPNGLSETSPATIEYKISYLGSDYTSGPLAFDMANPSEDPPHGLWGCLNDARAGGAMKAFLTQGNEPSDFTVSWSNICYDNGGVPVRSTTWGAVKALYNGK